MKRAVVECDGLHVEVRAYENEPGDEPSFVELRGLDCSLEGSMPGQYVPVPLDEADRIGEDVDFIGAGDEVVVLGPHPWVGTLRDVQGVVDSGQEVAEVFRPASVGSIETVRFARCAHTDSKAGKLAMLEIEALRDALDGRR